MDQDAEFNPLGQMERCCEHCAKEWVLWVEERVRKVKGENNEGERSGPVALAGWNGNGDGHKASVVVGSVANEWSTF